MSRRTKRMRELSAESSLSDPSSDASSYHQARHFQIAPRQSQRRSRHASGPLMHIEKLQHVRIPSTKKAQKQKNQSKIRKSATDADISTFHSFRDAGLASWVDYSSFQSNWKHVNQTHSLFDTRNNRLYSNEPGPKTERFDSPLDSSATINSDKKTSDCQQTFSSDPDLDSLSTTRVSISEGQDLLISNDKCYACAQYGLRVRPITCMSIVSGVGSPMKDYASSAMISDNLPYFRCALCDRTFHGDCLEYDLGRCNVSPASISNLTADSIRCPECHLFQGEISKIIDERALTQTAKECLVKWEHELTSAWVPQSWIKGKLKVAARSSKMTETAEIGASSNHFISSKSTHTQEPPLNLKSDVIAYASKSQANLPQVEIMIMPKYPNASKKQLGIKQQQTPEISSCHKDIKDRLVTYPLSKKDSWITLPSYISDPRVSKSKVYYCWLCQDLYMDMYHSHQYLECPLLHDLEFLVQRRMQISCPEERKVIEKLLRAQCMNLNFERIVLDCSDATLVACISQWSLQPSRVTKQKTIKNYNMDAFANDWVAKGKKASD